MPYIKDRTAAQTETLDPLILSARIGDPSCSCGCHCELDAVPECMGELFGDDIVMGGKVKKLFVTLGQFSIIRLERNIQLLMPAYDICMPAKDCSCNGGGKCKPQDPCEMFDRFEFPVEEFFPAGRDGGDCDGHHRPPNPGCCSCGRE